MDRAPPLSPHRFIPAAATALAVLLAVVSPSRAAEPARTVWDGIFSREQSTRGAAQYARTCERCHGTDTLAGEEVHLWGEEFWKSWREDTVDHLYRYVRDNMPNDEPGTLSDAQYLDLVAYVLDKNGLPAGSGPLTAQSASGVQIITRDGPGELPDQTLVATAGCLARGAAGWELTQAIAPQRAREGESLPAAQTAAPGTGRTFALKFVMSRLDPHVGKRMVVTGQLLGDGGKDGINVMSTQPSADACDPSGS